MNGREIWAFPLLTAAMAVTKAYEKRHDRGAAERLRQAIRLLDKAIDDATAINKAAAS
jgi:hypothetical protein